MMTKKNIKSLLKNQPLSHRTLLAPLLLTTLLFLGCDKNQNQPTPPSVTLTKPSTEQVTPYLIETGNTVASMSVDLVARVSGFLDSYNFEDGSVVKKGDLLFVIQPQPYLDQVTEAEATLKSDLAAYIYDKEEYQRQVRLYKQHATSLADVQQWLATSDEAAAAVESAKANLNNAKINYSYTHVTAPMNGRIGRHLVDPGNLVGNGEATTLASLQQLDPMYVYFTINELDLLKIREAARKKGIKTFDLSQIPMDVALQNETGFPHHGYLDFGATELNASTGTIQVRGILANPDYVLLPGLFVQARIALDKPRPQLTVPSEAVMYDQIGGYVYTLDNKHQVSQVHVKTGDNIEGRTVITAGLNPEDNVIVNGIQNVSPGEVVTVAESSS